MKNVIFTLIVVLLHTQTSVSQEWTSFGNYESREPTIELLESNDSIVEFNVFVPGMYSTEIDSFNRVEIPGHGRLDLIGYPEIPVITYLLAIPECDEVSINVTISDSIKIEGINIYPAPEVVEDTMQGGFVYLKEEFAYNDSIYSTDSWFTDTVVALDDPGAIRIQHVIRVILYPVKFNPVTKTIIAYPRMNVIVSFENPADSVNKNVGIFNELLGNTLINYQSNGLNASANCGTGLAKPGSWYWVDSLPNQKIDSACDYLIITHLNFYNNSNARQAIDSLAEHRANFNGYDVAIVRTSTIDSCMNGDEIYEKIHLLCQNTYYYGHASHTYDGKIAYVNLFGDTYLPNNIVGIPTYPEGEDVDYSRLTVPPGQEDPDPYPDIMLGRCSVDSETQVNNVVEKILGFEPQALAWKDSILTVLGIDAYPPMQSEVIMALKDILANFDNVLCKPASFNFQFPSSWQQISHSVSSMLSSYAKGKMFINYLGHGSDSGWSVLDAFYYSMLNNNHSGILPFVFASACQTGNFNYPDNCLAEQFLASDPDIGAIGYIGSSQSAASYQYRLVKDFFYSIVNNYSIVTGEAFMEMRCKGENVSTCDNFNMFCDPALNLFYENIDTIRADLLVKTNDILIYPDTINIGDTVQIQATIKNNSLINVTEKFYITCYSVNLRTNDTLYVNTASLENLEGYKSEMLSFSWSTTDIVPEKYAIIINVDTSSRIIEMNEDNNVQSRNIKVFHYNQNFPVTCGQSQNSQPVSFDINSSYEGEEIIIGGNIISSLGNSISEILGFTIGYTSIGNLMKNNNYQILQIRTDTPLVRSLGEPEWEYSLEEFITQTYFGPFIADADNDGFEEIMISQGVYNHEVIHYELICLKNDGNERWKKSSDGSMSNVITSYIEDDNDLSLIVTDAVEPYKIYFMKENDNQNDLIVYDSVQLTENSEISFILASDLNSDGFLEIVVKYDDNTSTHLALVGLSPDSSIVFKQLPPVCNDYYRSPIISDINNDGIEEIIIANSHEVLIFNSNLDSINYYEIEGTLENDISSADFNCDGQNDIVCYIKNGTNDHYLKAYNYGGEEVLSIPVFSSLYSWLTDINKDGKTDIIHSNNIGLFLISPQLPCNSIGYPGQHGNVRNTGVLRQPAYFPAEGDTVYWYNTILLTDSAAVVEGATVIIKPGTIVKAAAGSQLAVYGKLVAEGTERHPIKFMANINGAGKDHWKGIVFCNSSSSSIAYATVSDAEFGLLYEDFDEQTMENCTFINDSVGVGAYNSSPVIKACHFTGNGIGVGSYSNASPLITDLVYEQPMENAIKDNTTDIYICESSIYMDNGYNDIYNHPAEGQYMVIDKEGEYHVDATNNYWGMTDVEEIMEHLPSEVIIEPVCTSPNTGYKSSSSIAGDLLKEAYQELNEADYLAAEAGFKNLIANYPLSNQAYVAVSGLYACYMISGGNLGNLETYFNDVYSDTLSLLDKKLVFGYLNLVKRAREDYQIAIANYESVILNNPAYNDSVFAVINIGNTYIEAGLLKAGLGSLSYLRPQSEGAHIEKTIDLLLSLKTEKEQANQPRSRIAVGQNRPNPFTGWTQIPIYLPYAADVMLHLYNVLGIKVSSINRGRLPEGNNTIEFNAQGLGKGVYFYSIQVNGQFAGTGKMVVN